MLDVVRGLDAVFMAPEQSLGGLHMPGMPLPQGRIWQKSFLESGTPGSEPWQMGEVGRCQDNFIECTCHPQSVSDSRLLSPVSFHSWFALHSQLL
jgi:hypothetical protein